jgi:hypothetical protein
MDIAKEKFQVFQGYCSKPNGLFTLTTQLKAMTGFACTA